MIASVAVSAAVYAIDKPYSYRIPDHLQIQVGMRVLVPFGRGNRRCEAIILTILSAEEDGLKAIEAVLDEYPVLTEAGIRLAAFLRERYFCTLYDAIRAMLPAGLWFRAEETYTLADAPADLSEICKNMPTAGKILQLMLDFGGSVSAAALAESFPDEKGRTAGLQYLKRKKLIQSSLDLTQKVRDKSEKIAVLAVSAEESMEYAQRKKRSAPLQYEVLKLLCTVGSGSTKEICYLTGATMATVRRLEDLGYLSLEVRPVFRSPLPDHVQKAEPLVLNPAQQSVCNGLRRQSSAEKPGVALLYGVTGSGKTAVYIQMIQHTLDLGKSAIFLVPEIALTPQLLRLLISHFGKNVAVLHSALRVSERYDEWKRIRDGKARVVIGTRSAVFAPVQNLGLLIVDEEQEHTYKSENSPRYHAREVAIYRGSRDRSLVILGSATPSLESMYLAKTGVYQLYTLSERYNGKHLPDVELVDMKQELQNGNASAISMRLREALAENIQRGKQSILFLNRRGSSRSMICVDCGEVIMCPRCSVSLTYHAANGRLMCHHCGHSQPAVSTCAHCGGHLKTLGVGTQRVEETIHDLFPDVQILRMDADTISVQNSHEAMLERFQKENIPILLGTQMVAKGLNFENVTLVGVLDADSSLYLDHYRAAETTFSMLTQVVGRSGRGTVAGKAIIQTMTPDHSVIRLAAQQNYDQFYDLEITLRSLQFAPPFGDVFTVMFIGLFEAQTIAAAGYFRQLLENGLRMPVYQTEQYRIFGPSPAAISKVNNTFRYRLTLHGSNSRCIRQLLSHLLQVFSKDKISKGITAFVDINAYE